MNLEQSARLASTPWSRLCDHALEQSRHVAKFLHERGGLLIAGWSVIAAAIGLAKVAAMHRHFPNAISLQSLPSYIAPYLLIALAPALAWFLGASAFPSAKPASQPQIRLARMGRWNQLSQDEARRSDGFGIEGFLSSLVAGIFVSIVIRLAEYSAVMPSVPAQGPAWALALFRVMTMDLITLSFLYALCAVMALRHAPLFPRMLVYTWIYDLLMQLVIARYAASAGDLPQEIAQAMQVYLDGNIKKVLISVAVWMPYLIMSKRINLTFRNRLAAA